MIGNYLGAGQTIIGDTTVKNIRFYFTHATKVDGHLIMRCLHALEYDCDWSLLQPNHPKFLAIEQPQITQL